MGINTFNLGDVVAFSFAVDHVAGLFCHKHGITGKILREEAGLFVIDTGFYYEIFAKPEHLILVAAKSEIPEPIDIG